MGDWIEGPKYKTVRRESFNYYLLYTISGAGTVRFRNKEIRLDPGQICMIDCFEPHEYCTCQSNWHSVWFHLYGAGVKSCFEVLNPDDSFNVVDYNDTEAVLQFYRNLIQHFSSTQLEDELAISKLVLDFLYEIMIKSQTRMLCAQDKSPAWIEDIESFVDHRIFTDITISEIANYYSIPILEVEKAFMTHLKKTPAEYIRERKALHQSMLSDSTAETVNKELTDETFGSGSVAHNHPKWVLDAITYIEDNFDQNIKIQDIVRSSFISKPVFIKQFKQYTCMKPLEYLTMVRLKRSLNMLQNTFTPITEIAQCCGYTSSSLFTKRFKDWIGMSPKEFRHNHRMTDSLQPAEIPKN
jgi:AraC-like DNA-binding protein